MDEPKRQVGRKPIVNDGGERLERYSVFLYPSEWEKLSRASANRSEALRKIIRELPA